MHSTEPMKILIAEDSRITRLLLAAAVHEAGHEAVVAENGLQAWQLFEREPVPMVILDWLMPEMDGLAVCRKIRASEAGREAFILVATGRGTTEDVVEALAAGADDYVAKPIAPELLRARLTIAERRIALDASRRDTERALARAQWLAGIGQTSLALQHEINNPLTALLAEVDLLRMDPGAGDACGPQLATIAGLVRRIAQVVRRLATCDSPRTVEYSAGAPMLDLESWPTR